MQLLFVIIHEIIFYMGILYYTCVIAHEIETNAFLPKFSISSIYPGDTPGAGDHSLLSGSLSISSIHICVCMYVYMYIYICTCIYVHQSIELYCLSLNYLPGSHESKYLNLWKISQYFNCPSPSYKHCTTGATSGGTSSPSRRHAGLPPLGTLTMKPEGAAVLCQYMI